MRSPKKIVFIDSERRYRNKAKIAFTSDEYRCFLCCTGEEGIERIALIRPDVVVVDYFLPDISGEEVFTRYLSDPRFEAIQNIPFIALTTNGKVDKSQLYSLGFSACLSKPFRSRELVEHVQDVLVSHRLKMEETDFWETIREAKDFLERVVESSVDAIVTTDTNGVITYCNHASEELLGFTFEEMVGRRVSDFLKNNTTELMKIASLVSKTDKVQNYRTVLLRKGGTEMAINLSISKMKNRNGTVVGALGIGKSITEGLIEDDVNHESDRMSAVLETAVAVNHAINNPLVPILGNAQFLLQNEDLLDEDVRRRLKVIVSNARRIRDVTQKLARIRQPVTKEYLRGTRMLDIEASVQMN